MIIRIFDHESTKGGYLVQYRSGGRCLSSTVEGLQQVNTAINNMQAMARLFRGKLPEKKNIQDATKNKNFFKRGVAGKIYKPRN